MAESRCLCLCHREGGMSTKHVVPCCWTDDAAPTPERGDGSSGLEAALHRAFHDHWDPSKPLNLYADSPLWQVQAEAVERILADRLAAVQAERDAAQSEAVEWSIKAGRLSAQRDDLRAALDRVKALADEWETEGADLVRNCYSGRDVNEGEQLVRCATALRAAVEASRP